MTDRAAEFTEDGFLGGRLRLRQPRSGHRAGHDAMLLAAATPASSGDRVVDFGAGVGAAGLAVASRVAGIELVLVEIDQAEAFAAAGLAPDSVDVVLMNPPFNDPARHRASPHKAREIAHVARAATLKDWIRAARRILKSGGVLTLIWRADGVAEVLTALDRGFGSLEILPVHGAAKTPAIRVLVRATKGGKAPTRIYAALMLNDESGAPNERVQEILAGKGVLPLAIP
jgi:tRNA1(Val) A37 N6-methylase TrmN6